MPCHHFSLHFYPSSSHRSSTYLALPCAKSSGTYEAIASPWLMQPPPFQPMVIFCTWDPSCRHTSLPLLAILLALPPRQLLIPLCCFPSALSKSLQHHERWELKDWTPTLLPAEHLPWDSTHKWGTPHTTKNKNIFLGNSTTLPLFHLPMQPMSLSLLPDHFPKGDHIHRQS